MYRWDGGFIMVEPDKFEEGVEWYQQMFGWECMDQITSWVGRKAFMKMPRAGVVTIKSFEGVYDHFRPLRTEGNVKLVFVTYDLTETLKYLADKQVNYSEVLMLPNGQKYCDILAFDDTKITVVEEQRNEDNHVYPPAGILGFGSVNSIIHVKDHVYSSSWYEKHLGFEVLEVNKEKGYAHLQTEDAYDRT